MKIICSKGIVMPEGAKPTDGAKEFGNDACEYFYENELCRCSKFVYLAGINPQDGKDLNEGKCVDTWTPILMIENANTNRSQTSALESLRNETVVGQQQFNQLITRNISIGKDH